MRASLSCNSLCVPDLAKDGNSADAFELSQSHFVESKTSPCPNPNSWYLFDAMVESESLEQATEIVKKLTSPEEDTVKFVENIAKVKRAIHADSIEDLIKVRSEAAPVHACQIGDLKPAPCPSGSQHLEAFKRKVAAAGEERENIFRGARDTLTKEETAANKIDADEVASTDKNYLSSQLDKLDKARKLCAAVAGSVDEVQGQDDVLESEQVSLHQLSQAARDEKYQEVTAQRIKNYFNVMSEVAKALTGSGLPMKLNEILDVPNQCDGLSRVGALLDTWMKEINEIIDKQEKHLDTGLQPVVFALCSVYLK